MPAVDDGRVVKVYGEAGDASGSKEVLIGTLKEDAAAGLTTKLASFATGLNTNLVEKAYIDSSGQLRQSAGSNSGLVSPGGTLSVNTTPVGNVGVSDPDDLMTYTLPANSLNATARGLKIRAWGTTANNANAKSIRLVFGSTNGPTKLLTASVAGSWCIEAVIYRTGLNAQTIFTTSYNYNGSTVASTDGASVVLQSSQGSPTETETSAIVIKCQSMASTSNNDIVQAGMHIEFL